MNIRVAEREAPCNVVLENITDYAYEVKINHKYVSGFIGTEQIRGCQ